MHFETEKNAETPFEVRFKSGQNTEFFDLDTLKTELNVKEADGIKDKIMAMYWKNIWKHDFGYITKGIEVNQGKGPELMFVGNLKFDTTLNKFIILRPTMVLGSDRMELYEFMARRREVLIGHNKQLVKLMLGITFAHALLV